MLPLLLLAAHRRNIRTPRKRDADASCSGSADTSVSQSRARSCACCARVSSSWRYVASGRPFDIVKKVRCSVLGKTITNSAQLFPATVGCRRLAIARAGVPICSTRWAKAFAVLPALNESRSSKQPCLSHRRSHVERVRRWIEGKDVRIVRSRLTLRRKDEVLLFGNFDPDVLETPAARHLADPRHPSTEIKASRTSGGEPTFNMNGLCRAHVSGFPNRIVRRNGAVHMRCLRLQRADVKGQHKFLKLASLCRAEKPAEATLFLQRAHLPRPARPARTTGLRLSL